MRIFIICTVRGASDEYKQKLEDYVAKLEAEGHEVHLPHRDTKQDQSGWEICAQNGKAIAMAHEVHIFYNPDSQGTHFDMGMAFAYGRKLVLGEPLDPTEGKSFKNMLREWHGIYNKD